MKKLSLLIITCLLTLTTLALDSTRHHYYQESNLKYKVSYQYAPTAMTEDGDKIYHVYVTVYSLVPVYDLNGKSTEEYVAVGETMMGWMTGKRLFASKDDEEDRVYVTWALRSERYRCRKELNKSFLKKIFF